MSLVEQSGNLLKGVGGEPEDARKYGTFHSWVNGNYIRSQGLAVRRQVDLSDDVVSLGRLLDYIAKFPTVLSRERYLGVFSELADLRECAFT